MAKRRGRFGRRARVVYRTAKRSYRRANKFTQGGIGTLVSTAIGAAGYKYVVRDFIGPKIAPMIGGDEVFAETGVALIAPMLIRNKLVRDTAKVTLAVNAVRLMDRYAPSFPTSGTPTSSSSLNTTTSSSTGATF